MPVGKLNSFNPSSDDFESWVGILNNYLIANDVDKTKEKDKARSIFLSSIGISSYTVLHDLVFPDKPESKGLDELIKSLQDHFKPAPKAISERFRFHCRKQLQGESVTLFLAELRKLAVTCKFGDLDVALRDQFVFGLTSEAAQKRLFLEDDSLTLQKAVQIAISQESAEVSTLVVRSSSSPTPPVNKVSSANTGRAQQKSNTRKSSGSSKCPNCGNDHSKSDCPHKDVICYKCQKKGHFAKFCRSSSSSSKKNLSAASQVQTVRQVSPQTDLVNISLCINGIGHVMELDTGSKISFVPVCFWQQLGSPTLQKSSVPFKTFTGQIFTAKGKFRCEITYNGQCMSHFLHVADGSSLFGRDLIRKFKMDWKNIESQCSPVNQVQQQNKILNSLLDEYKDIFDKPVGTISNFKAKLVLRDDAVPRFFTARPVPFALREKVDAELKKMESAGVITRVEHSDWASPLVVVPKPDGRVRITGDFKKTINSQLCVTQYPLARDEVIFESISGGEKFSKLDGPDAFHQVEVDDSCKKFLVINTPRGLFQYNVLPQGIASSPAIFQELMDKMLQNVEMCNSFIDDVICSGRDDDEHIRNLRQTFQNMRECNYRLSRPKCQFLQTSVKFLGRLVSSEGLRTDPLKVEAMMSMKEPQNVTEIKSFLGLINFYSQFVKDLSHYCAPLNNLTRSGVEWKWTKQCRDAFQHIKKLVSSTPVLAHYKQSVPVGISCDASSVGLGVVLFHKYEDGSERPIAYASKTLSPAERNYSQIDREALSIVFGVKRFFQYLCGRKFLLVTDHKPLLAIFGSNRDLPPLVATRLHRWNVFLSSFQFDIVYRNTLHHGNADVLSRLPLSDSAPVDKETEISVNAIRSGNPVTSKFVRFRTSKDSVLSSVVRHVQNGWPAKADQVQEKIRPYFPHRHELSVEQGIIMCGPRVVLPISLQADVLKQLHDTHPGIVRMKSMARQYVWWPGIDGDIEKTVKSCTECAIHRANPSVAPLHPWSFPEKPWQRLHIDLAGPFQNRMWLIVVDAHSKWPEVFDIGKDSTSSNVICCLRETFSRFGIPETVVSDNGPQFTSSEFKQFCVNNGVRHSTSSAYHPRSNGEAERFIRTFKSALQRGANGNVNLALCDFLLNYRITPHSTTNVSPSELLLRSKPRTLLDLIRPDVNARVRVQQELQQEHFNGKSSLREFQDGQKVWVQSFSKDSPKWSSGKIVRSMGPVSYEIDVGGRVMKRHVDHILSGEVPEVVPGPVLSPVKVEPTSPQFHSAASTPVKAEEESSSSSLTPRQSPVSPSTPEVQVPPAKSPRPKRQVRQPNWLNYGSFD